MGTKELIQEKTALMNYLKKLELACSNFVMQLPGDGSEGQKILEPGVINWEIQTACHFANRIQTNASKEAKRLEEMINRMNGAK